MMVKFGLKLDDVRSQNNDLIDQNNDLIERVEDVQEAADAIKEKLNIAVEDRAPQPNKNSKRERFMLIKRNDEDYPYYTIRTQDVNAKTAI
jgi:hypothetical protein